LLKVESYKKGIVLSTSFNILNKAIVFLNGILIAYFFGVQSGTDLVFYINNSVLLLGAFITSINSTVVIPESMRIRTTEGNEQATGFLNFFICFYASVILAAILVIILIDPAGFFSIISNFKKENLVNNKSLLFLALPLFGMIFITNLLIDILTSHKFFTIPMIVGIMNGLFSILCITLFHQYLGLKSVLIGLLFSYSLNIIMLVFIMKKFLKWKFRIIKVVKEKRIWKNLGFAQLGNFTSTAASYTPMYILSGFNTGIITALTFAQQISSLPTALITTQFSAVAGIKFNELYTAGEKKEINKIFYESAAFLHFLMIPLACFIFYYSTEIIDVLLGFTSLSREASENAALFLKYLGLLLPFMVINTLMARLFMASHKIRESFVYQVAFNIVLIFCLYIAVHILGIIGYPVAIVLTYFLNFGFCYFLEKKYFNFINYAAIFREFWLVVLVNILTITVVAYCVKFAGMNNSFLNLALAATLYALLLLAVNRIFRLNDVVTVHLESTLKKLFKYGATGSGQ
jgi:putative peptidoglycan lipid II flippase